ncbi:hypothetical protein B0H19DRAFT_1259052 [Mycena capillaripes]|nr:hypothetical protein B0H19DRAFT_1259052 [Mycena capillaripes]
MSSKVDGVIWALIAVFFLWIFSITPSESAVDRVLWALVTIFVSSIFLKKNFTTISAHQPNQGNYYPCCPDDVFQVRRFLVEFLPPELVNTILDDAQYWPRIRCTSNAATVHASSNSYHNASLRCLITPAFPSSETLGGPAACLRVKLIKFGIFSHDQGWGGHPQDHGTYQGSYTWFEATILRPGKAPALEGWRRWALALGYTKFRPIRPLFEVTNWCEPDGRWRVQTNRCTISEPKYHTIVWQAEGSEGSDIPSEFEKNGSGDGAGFIERLAPGDRIGVVARAMFPGWVNHVGLIEVIVYYAV